MVAVINVSKNIEHQECINCGVDMWISASMLTELKKSKATFYCIHGHGQSYTKGTIEILKEKIAAKDETIAMLQRQIDAKPRRGRPRK